MNEPTPAPLDYAVPQPRRNRLLRTIVGLAWGTCASLTLLALLCFWIVAVMPREPGIGPLTAYGPGAILLLIAGVTATVALIVARALPPSPGPDRPPWVRRVAVSPRVAWALVFSAVAMVLAAVVSAVWRVVADSTR